jgi:ATP-binding cassette subfamily F protein 3
MFKPGRTVFQEGCDTRRAHSETNIRSILGSFLFRGDMVFKKVEVLSGGEKSRLGLAKILLDPPNLLLMDEPTTHLDMSSVQVLIEALKAFEGTFVFISHDVYFIRNLADHIIHVNQGKITWYPGNYDYFLHKKSQEDSEEAELFRSELRTEEAHHKHTPSQPSTEPKEKSDKPKSGGKKTKEQKRAEAEARNAKYRERMGLQELTEEQKLKKEEEEILSAMGDPATHENPEKVTELTLRLGVIQKQLKNLSSQ